MAFLPCAPLPAGGPTRLDACTTRPRMALRGRSPEQRDAELQAQKEILERRRNEKKSAKYMESVAARRADAEAFFQSNQLDIQPGEDPLEAWKRKEARGLIKPIGYEDVPEGGIPLPAASFGIPKYDNGERTCPDGSFIWQPDVCWSWGGPLCQLDWSATRALNERVGCLLGCNPTSPHSTYTCPSLLHAVFSLPIRVLFGVSVYVLLPAVCLGPGTF